MAHSAHPKKGATNPASSQDHRLLTNVDVAAATQEARLLTNAKVSAAVQAAPDRPILEIPAYHRQDLRWVPPGLIAPSL